MGLNPGANLFAKGLLLGSECKIHTVCLLVWPVFVARSFVSVSSVPEPGRAVQYLGGQCAAEQPIRRAIRRAGVRHGRVRPAADGPDHALAGIPGGAAAGDGCKLGVSALPSQARDCGPGIFFPPTGTHGLAWVWPWSAQPCAPPTP